MAWISVDKDLKSQDQSQTSHDPEQSTTTQQRIETWFVECDGDGRAVDVVQAEGASITGGAAVPTVGASYTIGGVSGWIVTQLIPTRTGPNTFQVQVQYTRKTAKRPDDNPDKWKVDIAISGVKYTQDAHRDRNNLDVSSSAGEPFDPSVPDDFYDEKIEISYQTNSPPDLLTFRGKVNDGDVTFSIRGASRSYTARQLKFEDGEINTSFALDDATVTWRVKLTFTAREDKYITHVLDRGFDELDDDGKRTKMQDLRWLTDLTAPAKLDGEGHRLAEGDDPYFIPFEMEKETDFSPLFVGL